MMVFHTEIAPPLPGDIVTVNHPELGWNNQRCVVLAVIVPGSDQYGCDFTLRPIDEEPDKDKQEASPQCPA